MVCRQCATEAKIFSSEIAIHFPGVAGLNKPIVWVFPKLLVCLQCGFTEFTVPERELNVLVQGKRVPGAVVSLARASEDEKEKSDQLKTA